MSPEEREKILADIQLALKNFPKVIQQKRRAHRHKERIMKPFMKLARQLEKRIAEQSSSSGEGESVDGLDKRLAPVGGGETHAWRVCPMGSHFVKVKDHLVDVHGEDLMEPTVNICVGIRWLFHKRKLAEAKLGGDVSWDETVIFYKGYRNKPADELARKMLPFRTFMEKLEKCQ